MTNLKPCPFCGSKNLEVHTFSFYVKCEECGGEGPWNDYSEDDAISDWNKRYNLQLKEQND